LGVVDFVGSSASFEFGFNGLMIGGRLVSVGLFGGGVEISPAMLVMKAVSVVGSFVGTLGELRELMSIACAGGMSELPIATRPMDQLNEAMDDLKGGRVRGRVVLRP
jgi:D-arabinose 1-dehydrogenase-like Zn-dependent alcohol dehydrogenase